MREPNKWTRRQGDRGGFVLEDNGVQTQIVVVGAESGGHLYDRIQSLQVALVTAQRELATRSAKEVQARLDAGLVENTETSRLWKWELEALRNVRG